MFTLPLKCLSHTLIFGRFIFKPLNAWLVAGKVTNTSPVPDLLTEEEEEVLHSQGRTCRRSDNGSENVSGCLGTCPKSQVCDL